MNEQPHPRKATLLVITVFLLGVGLGAVGSYGLMKRAFAGSSERVSPAQRHARWVEHLTNELSLTPDQRQEVDKILTQLQARYKDIRERQSPEIKQARQASRDQIRALLTEDQKRKFDDFLRRLDEERAKKPQP